MKSILYLDWLVNDRIQQMKLAGIRRYAQTRGWSVQALSEHESRPSKLRRVLKTLRPDGCIVECSAAHKDLVPALFGKTPVVYLDCPRSLFGGGIPRVLHDGKATTRAAFRELASNRPDAYGVVGFKWKRYWSRLRERAFRKLCEESGKRCLVFPWRPEERSGRVRRLAKWVAELPKRSAVFAVNDEMSLEVLDACRLSGRRVPSDMTVLGVDNIESVCESSAPRLSSIQIDFELAGYHAAKLLDDRIRLGSRAAVGADYGPMMTVRRESTRGFGRREPRILAAVELIRREACEGLTAADVVRRIGGSRRLVDLRFRETLGHSILDEIQNVRLGKVCFLLARTETPIGAIASLCGYRTDIALRKLFRQRMGTSLSDWRKANRAK